LLQSNIVSLNRFIDILKDLVDVFQLSLKDISIFYDKNISTIAFNRNRKMFFNLRFYLGLHDEDCKIKPTSNVMTYWFMIFCHELAHNFIQQHSSEHEVSSTKIFIFIFIYFLYNIKFFFFQIVLFFIICGNLYEKFLGIIEKT
jgi:hypothetical protein